MCPPAVAPLFDIKYISSNEELFKFMFCMARADFFPANVITDVNPFNCLPETLPENTWYFTNSMENRGAEGGFWMPRGEPREIFGDAFINGWEETHEFYEGRGPKVEKTNWLMLEYYMTSKVSGAALSARDAKSLCKVFRSGSLPLSNSEMLQNAAGTEFRRENYLYSLSPDNFNIPTEQCVTNQMQVNTTSCNVMRRASSFFLSHPIESLPELGHINPGDYLELLDLGIPQSPSSQSDNSSCMTMLSDEIFDYLVAMLDSEVESGEHVEHSDAGCNLNVTDSSKPDDVVVQAAISGLPIKERSSQNARDGKPVNRDGSPPLTLASQSRQLSDSSQTPSADGRNKTDGRLKKLKRKYLPTSSSQSSDGSNSGRAPSPGPGGRTKTDGALKKLQKKYLCFMPF
ncbi:NAC domain-containing protein 74 [Eucalyptus grandis]|uniref:NAC domain-containing protein 74 n=1 Tax=Eucalyptus grandis TaxID=71139 RepID=UPI00192EA63E|nr:NAC domain-containing protein 74 [Eucalyptus grandis]